VLAARRAPRAPDPHLLPTPASGTSGDSRDRPNIFFLGFDGIEADIMSAYGYERATTPFLESIREDTLFFENAFSNATRTHGSLVTLLTGRLPFSTRVTFPPTVLQGEGAHRHLPGLLKRLRYHTFQVGIRHYADAEDANLLGFDAANYRWQGVDLRPKAVTDETVVFRRAVAERLDERLGRLLGLAPVASGFAHVQGRQIAPELRDDRRVATLQEYFKRAPEPWFVHLHMADTHCCQYRPQQMHFSGNQTKAARDSQLLETDGHIRTLFEALRTSGRLDRTIVVISSDHTSQWRTTERVPLMMRFPGARLKGRVSANVQLADVAPTMLGYLGLEIPPWMDGMSLVDPSKLPAERPIFGVSDIGRREGVPGFRLLLESGPPNYGASAAMMIAGSHWFELNLRDGQLTSGPVPGHTRAAPSRMPDADARGLIEGRLAASGFRVSQPQQTESSP
jgi:arylsulfatase A-like enzyme